MEINELVSLLNLHVFSGKGGLDRQVTGGYVSDLLSDVMGNAGEGQLWITLQSHKNILAVASLKDLSGIILVKGIKPDQDTIDKSEEENIPILGTADNTFHVTGKLYNLLNS